MPTSAQVRVTDAERDHVVERLQSAFADGRLDAGELDERLHLAINARTRGELGPPLADLSAEVSVPEVLTAPQPTVRPTVSERAWATFGHLAVLGCGFLGPLLVLLIKGGESAFVRDQAAEALNFQLTFLIVCTGLAFGAVLTLGLAALAYIPLGFAWFALAVVSSLNSANGTLYRYPANLRLVR